MPIPAVFLGAHLMAQPPARPARTTARRPARPAPEPPMPAPVITARHAGVLQLAPPRLWRGLIGH